MNNIHIHICITIVAGRSVEWTEHAAFPWQYSRPKGHTLRLNRQWWVEDRRSGTGPVSAGVSGGAYGKPASLPVLLSLNGFSIPISHQ